MKKTRTTKNKAPIKPAIKGKPTILIFVPLEHALFIKQVEAALRSKYQVRIIAQNLDLEDMVMKFRPTLVIRVGKPLPTNNGIVAIWSRAERQIPFVLLTTFDTFTVDGRDHSDPQARIWSLYFLTHPDIIARLVDTIIAEELQKKHLSQRINE